MISAMIMCVRGDISLRDTPVVSTLEFRKMLSKKSSEVDAIAIGKVVSPGLQDGGVSSHDRLQDGALSQAVGA